MRKVKIDNNGDVIIGNGAKAVICPFGREVCFSNCAWFSINKHFDKNEQRQFAYCGDKLIGEIEESS